VEYPLLMLEPVLADEEKFNELVTEIFDKYDED
jgi:hypothetical protein